MGSGTKTKSNEPVSQIACVNVSIFFVLNVHIPAYDTWSKVKGEELFSELFFIVVSADRRLRSTNS